MDALEVGSPPDAVHGIYVNLRENGGSFIRDVVRISVSCASMNPIILEFDI